MVLRTLEHSHVVDRQPQAAEADAAPQSDHSRPTEQQQQRTRRARRAVSTRGTGDCLGPLQNGFVCVSVGRGLGPGVQ